MTRIALLEDDLRVSSFIKTGLLTESYQIETFTVIHELVDTLSVQKFDVLIMDRMIEKTDALGWIKTIKAICPMMKIIILSALSGSLNRIKGLELGADDYLEKPFQFHELSLRVQKVSNKTSVEIEQIIQYEDLILELEGQKMQRAGTSIFLSPFEFKLMVLFVKSPQKVFSRTELLDRIWGSNNGTSSNVVDVAIAKLRKKINFKDVQPLINARRGSGYVLYGTTPA